MFRDDLDRVVDEMENSEVMWLGIQQGVHGYDEIAIDDTVSVRSEVARLTRLLDKAVRSNTMNDRKCAFHISLTIKVLAREASELWSEDEREDVLTTPSGHVHECRWRRRKRRLACPPTSNPNHLCSGIIS